jgi:hypothetical protein
MYFDDQNVLGICSFVNVIQTKNPDGFIVLSCMVPKSLDGQTR